MLVSDGKKLLPGDKVHYQPEHYADDEYENGIVKRLTPDGKGVFVVYNCGGNWENFENYTAANTRFEDVKPCWREVEDGEET